MFYDHIDVPSFIKVERFEMYGDCVVQVIGRLGGRTRAQSEEMKAGGFFSDTSHYIVLLQDKRTVAWLGFARHSDSGVVNVRQIQGRKSCTTLPKGWAEFLLQSFVDCLDRDEIHTVRVLPAYLSIWWSGAPGVIDVHALRGRLVTYYDRIPRRLGFTLADKELIEGYLTLSSMVSLDKKPTTPHHTLRLGR